MSLSLSNIDEPLQLDFSCLRPSEDCSSEPHTDTAHAQPSTHSSDDALHSLAPFQPMAL